MKTADKNHLTLLLPLLVQLGGVGVYAAIWGDDRGSDFLSVAVIATIVAVVLNLLLVSFILKRCKNLAGNTHPMHQTEKTQAEKLSLEAEQESSNTIVNSLPVIIVVLDSNGCIVQFNRYTETHLGFSLNEESGKDAFDVFFPEPTREEIRERFLHAPDTKNRRGEDVQIVDSHGTPHDVTWRHTTMKKNDGSVHRILAVAWDMSERNRLSAQLNQTQKLEAIGQLAAGIAHEINTPTQYVVDNIHFLCDTFATLHHVFAKYTQVVDYFRTASPAPELISELDAVVEDADIDFLLAETPEAIAQTLEGVSRVAGIVQSLKEFAQPGGTEKKRITNINNAIESTIVVARNEWRNVANIETHLDPNLPEIEALSGELNQVFLSMIINAAQAIEKSGAKTSNAKGTIAITTAQDADCIEIRIKDTGVGISSKIKDKVFDPFFTTREVGKGVGQGLSIAHNVITKKHSGTIDIESVEGKGTTFIIRIPLPADCCDASIDAIRW